MPFSSKVVSRPIVKWATYIRARPLIAYGTSVVAVVLATVLRWLIGPETALPFITYFPAVTIVGLLGGVGPGALASLISAVAGTALFASRYEWGVADPFVMSAVFFLLACGLKLFVIGLLNVALDELVEQDRNIRQLVEAVPAGIVVVAHDGSISLVNASAQLIFGYDRAEMLGRSVETLIPESKRSKHSDHRTSYLFRPQAREMGIGLDLSCLRKDGTTFSAEIGLSPLVRGAQTSVVATVIDVSERLQALERERFLLRELHHRSQNMLAVVQSIIRRTLEGPSEPEEAKQLLLSRVHAMAEAQQVLLQNVWEGANLQKIILAGVGAFSSRLTVSGCDLVVKREAAQQLVLIFHELAINAFKHGALSSPHGAAVIAGRVDRDKGLFEVIWSEEGGPPVAEPTRRGFGSTILQHAARQLAEEVTLEYRPSGLRYELRIPLQRLE